MCCIYVPYPVARPVQCEQEGHDTDGHVLASNFIGGVCTYEKAKPEFFKKASKKSKKGKKRPGTNSTDRVPKKVCFKKHWDLCKKHGGTYTTHNTCDCCRFEKDGKEKSGFRAANRGGKKANPVNQNFVQLTEKIEKLEKASKKSGKKGIAIPTPNRKLGQVALGK
jgi:hypothetical protein